MGCSHRQALRARDHDHRGHRQRQRPRPASRGWRSGVVHPDRRADQSRKLRRSHRHQFDHLYAHRYLHGSCFRDTHRRGDERSEATAGKGACHTRKNRRADPGGEQGDSRCIRVTQAGRGAREFGGKRRPGGQGRGRVRRHHRQSRWTSREFFLRTATDHYPGPTRNQDNAAGVAQGRHQGPRRERGGIEGRRAFRAPRSTLYS